MTSPRTARSRPARPRAAPVGTFIDLALQGGGSQGAFTWGVLDALLEDGRFGLSGVSGTSAGALNAAVLATGLARGRGRGDADGGRACARAALDAFWGDVGQGGRCFGGIGVPDAAFNLSWQPAFRWMNAWLQAFSPYQFNPLGLNPLRDIVRQHVDMDLVRAGDLPLFITATSVRTGRPRVFTGATLSLDALMASACLPQMFQAVELPVDGVVEPFWDGGYSGNPALWPLIYNTASLDVLLVKINPLQRLGVPDTPMEIADRVNEITFNAGLIGEMRAIAFVGRLLREQKIDAGRYKALRLHMVADDEGLAGFDASSKLNTDARFLDRLFGLGRAAGQRWLVAHGEDVGHRASLDIEAVFLDRDG